MFLLLRKFQIMTLDQYLIQIYHFSSIKIALVEKAYDRGPQKLDQTIIGSPQQEK